MADPPGATGDILPLGTWDGTVYTAPSGGGIVVPIDPTTDQGSVQEAAHDMMDVLDAGLEFILENRHRLDGLTRISRTTTLEAIYWMAGERRPRRAQQHAHAGEPGQVPRGSGELAGRPERGG